MNNANYIFREPKNEPVFSYAPGTPERAALKAELDRQYKKVVEIPLIINGKDVKDGQLESIDLEVILDTKAIPTETVNALAGDKPTKQLSLIHEGDFGFKAVLKIYVGTEYAGKLGKLYYYNASNVLEYITSDQIDAEGYAELEFSHASDYVVVMEEQEPAPTKPEQDSTQDHDAPEASKLPMILGIAAIIVVALIVIVVIRKRKA